MRPAATAAPTAAAAMSSDDASNKRRKADAAELDGGVGPAATKAVAPDAQLKVNPKRVRELRKGVVEGDGPVIYWCAGGLLACVSRRYRLSIVGGG